MYQAIEFVMFRDFVFDFMLLLIALNGVVRIRYGKLLLAAFLGSVFTSMMVLLSPKGIFRYLMIIPATLLMTCISAGSIKLSKVFICVCRLLSVSGLFSALCSFTSFHWSAACILFLFLFPIFRCSQCKSDIHSICGDFRLYIVNQGVQLTALGIIDTGNHLTEPISGLPVIVLSSDSISDNRNSKIDFMTSNNAFRLVPFGGVGGNGCMTCYMPDRILLSTGNNIHELCDMWVAIYEGTLPGGHEALMPPETIRYINSNNKRRRILCPGTDL